MNNEKIVKHLERLQQERNEALKKCRKLQCQWHTEEYSEARRKFAELDRKYNELKQEKSC